MQCTNIPAHHLLSEFSQTNTNSKSTNASVSKQSKTSFADSDAIDVAYARLLGVLHGNKQSALHPYAIRR